MEGRYADLIDKLKNIEKNIDDYWRENNIIEKVLNRGRKKFYFLDGPPYVTGSIHIGTAWNKIIKDMILRLKRMQGYKVWSKPGYDTHGLPIENAVEKDLGITNKKQIIEMGIDKFNEKCKELVKKTIKKQTKQFMDLSIWMDWDNYYATYENEYISRTWFVIKQAYEKGLLGEELRVFHWCPRCETVLSDHEVAMGYEEKESPSIYVKFKVKDREDLYLLIWTTTPWTLPSNTAVMAHPDKIYYIVKEEKKKEKYIIIEDRFEDLFDESKYEIIKKVKGEELYNFQYVNPLENHIHLLKELKNGKKVVLSREYVSPEEGTGLVHAAPSHGKEDFEIAKRYGLPIINIVNGEGKFTEEAGKYKGMYVFDAENIIINDLEKDGAIFKREKIIHKYPHCWRCHTPLILRATRQWVIYFSKLKDKMLNENRNVNWVPDWAGKERFSKWLETARDWVISRQRYWGTPLPIWRCKSCKEIRVIGSVKELEEEGYKLVDLHRPFIDKIILKCKKCNGEMHREPDVLDVWIDSGAASWASIGYPDDIKLFNYLWPIDFITEGHDQTRGWFYSLLALAILTFDETPYKTVLMHGYALDEFGREMHKHLGNVIPPEEVINRYGIDLFRAFLLKHPPWEDLKISYKKIEGESKILNIMFNVFDFFDTYASIDNFKFDKDILKNKYNDLFEEDKWILSLFEKTVRDINQSLEKYHIHMLMKNLEYFITEVLSRRYIKLIRRRVWLEENVWEKITVYITMFHILKKITLMLAPVLPHIAEYLYQEIIKKYDINAEESVHLDGWPREIDEFIDMEIIEKYNNFWVLLSIIDSIRYSKGIKKRQPLEAIYISGASYDRLSDRQIYLLKEMANVNDLRRLDRLEISNFIDFKLRIKDKVLGPILREKLPIVKRLIEQLPSTKVIELLDKGYIEVKDKSIGTLRVDLSNVDIIEEERPGYSFKKTDFGYVILDIKINRRNLLRGLAREIVRRIQLMRKEINLDVMDKIVIYISTNDTDILEAVKKEEKYILYETRGHNINIVKKFDKSYFVKKWEIDGVIVYIGIRKIDAH